MSNSLKLSTILIGIGITLLLIGGSLSLYGFSVMKPYQEKTFNRHESKEVVPGVRNDIGNWLNVQMENDRRKAQARRSESIARPYIVSGLVICVIGLLPLIFGFIQRNNEIEIVVGNDKGGVSPPLGGQHFCPSCGNKYIASKGSQFCENCGQKLKGEP